MKDDEVEAVTGGSSECGNISSYTDSQMTPVNCEILSFCSSVAIEMGID